MNSTQLESMIRELLENRTGPLPEILPQFDPNTIQHAAEITKERRTNPKLRKTGFWTADYPMCTNEGTAKNPEVFLYIAPREYNLIFKNIQEAAKQLRETQNYKPSKDGILLVKNSVDYAGTKKINLNNINLHKENDEYSYLLINTKKHDKLNSDEQSLAEIPFGEGDEFEASMKMLYDSEITETRTWTLTPKYVINHAKPDSAISRACWLYLFNYLSSFGADVSYVGNYCGCVRGVPLIAEGDARKINIETYGPKILNYLKEHPEEAKRIIEQVK